MARTMTIRLTGRPRTRRGALPRRPHQTRFEVFGEEMREKVVKLSGNSGRIYLPLEWVGKTVKVVRLD